MIIGVRVGDVIADRYRVEEVLGAGAMGVVVAARHLGLDDPVAIKFLAQDLVESPNALGRFHREARAAARIKHEHVIRVHDVGKLASGVPYLVMERLAGSDLATLLIDEGPLPLAESVRYVREACAGIAEAHRHGIVHRDIKPSNLFCVRHANGRRSVKVLDFGISKLIEPTPDG
ncbi:MAG TPA: serine/threonine-protein kinase, partial [Polyangiaceae bacterium]|nr:serine/threonine-protein kinase [Polyangiaceae bacterium]